MIRLAVLADPHLHDPRFGRGDGAPPLLRSLAETQDSTRVFNESGPALRQALREIAAEGIGLCLIAGDLTDDGQPASWAAVAELLAGHSARHGTRFFACPGNHDQWALAGKPLAKGFVDAAGRVSTLAAEPAAGELPCPGMRMSGYAEALAAAGALGYRRDPRDLLWETPFGPSDDLGARTAPVALPGGAGAEIPDLSYLVEPVPGLWLLSLDANVYLPDGQGGFTDGSTEGWSAALRHKPWLTGWIAGVVARARHEGKDLVAFSHYPMADIFSGTIPELDRLGGRRAGRRRMPQPAESRVLAATGLRLHFSGHWHVDAATADPAGELVNVSVPSPVGFAAGWTLVELEGGAARVLGRPLREVPGFDLAAGHYRAEAARGGPGAGLADAPDYGAFLDRHFHTLVLTRRLAEDWPAEMPPLLPLRLGDLPGMSIGGEAAALPFAELFVDWYRLRESGGAAIAEGRRPLYADLARRFGGTDGVLGTFFRTLGRHLAAAEAGRQALARLAAPAAAECRGGPAADRAEEEPARP